MRTILLALAMGLSILSFSQEGLTSVKFVFGSQSSIEQELSKNAEKKVFNITVKGILTLDHRKELITKVKKTRGVVDFVLTDDNKAKLTIYKYAKNWKYWSMFIKHSSIGAFEIDGKVYTAETITELEE